jgi:hypothetical protein
LRGRRTLEEDGPNVVVGCNNVVLTWLIGDGAVDQFDEEEDGYEEVEGGVMIGCVREQKKQDSEDGGQERNRFPWADF